MARSIWRCWRCWRCCFWWRRPRTGGGEPVEGQVEDVAVVGLGDARVVATSREVHSLPTLCERAPATPRTGKRRRRRTWPRAGAPPRETPRWPRWRPQRSGKRPAQMNQPVRKVHTTLKSGDPLIGLLGVHEGVARPEARPATTRALYRSATSRTVTRLPKTSGLPSALALRRPREEGQQRHRAEQRQTRDDQRAGSSSPHPRVGARWRSPRPSTRSWVVPQPRFLTLPSLKGPYRVLWRRCFAA